MDASMTVLTYILALIVTLGVLVTVHEFGHYLIARMSGVRILRFAVGFGKPIWSKFDERGTEWAVAAIPLGGYVRMLDERDPDFERHSDTADVSYNVLHPAWRIAIALGGPVANFVLAFAVYWLLALAGSTTYVPVLGEVPPESPVAQAGLQPNQEIIAVDGVDVRSWQELSMALAARLGDTGDIALEARQPGADRSRSYAVRIDSWHRGVDEPDLFGSLGIEPRVPAIVGQVVPDTAAAAAGLEPWDQMLAIDGQALADWNAFQEQIAQLPEQTVTMLIRRGDVEIEKLVTPGRRDVEGEAVGFLGVGPALNELRYGPLEAVGVGLEKCASTVGLTLGLMRKMLTGDVSLKNLSGPITIAKVAGDSAKVGWKYFLGVLALLSISLGILNLLPIPVLDGGHVVFATAEWIKGKPVSDRTVEMGYQFGMVVVAGLMVLALYNDVARFFSG